MTRRLDLDLEPNNVFSIQRFHSAYFDHIPAKNAYNGDSHQDCSSINSDLIVMAYKDKNIIVDLINNKWPYKIIALWQNESCELLMGGGWYELEQFDFQTDNESLTAILLDILALWKWR